MPIEQQIYQKIIKANKVLIVTHYNPDGDALSSLSVFSCILKSLNKNYQAYCRTPLDPSYHYLPHLAQAISEMDDQLFVSFDLIISLDCGSLDRTGLAPFILARKSGQFFIEIDHHPKVESLSDLEYRFNTSATTELIYNFCQSNHLKISQEMARGILLGLASDTGGFVYPATSSSTITIAAQMLWRGARLPAIIKQVFHGQSLAGLKLWGLALSRLKINEEYGFAYTILTYEDFAKYQVTESITDELAGWLVCLGNVKALLLLKEARPGLIKGSWRTASDSINVGALARIMGGGGHSKAAGFACGGELINEQGSWQLK